MILESRIGVLSDFGWNTYGISIISDFKLSSWFQHLNTTNGISVIFVLPGHTKLLPCHTELLPGRTTWRLGGRTWRLGGRTGRSWAALGWLLHAFKWSWAVPERSGDVPGGSRARNIDFSLVLEGLGGGDLENRPRVVDPFLGHLKRDVSDNLFAGMAKHHNFRRAKRKISMKNLFSMEIFFLMDFRWGALKRKRLFPDALQRDSDTL